MLPILLEAVLIFCTDGLCFSIHGSMSLSEATRVTEFKTQLASYNCLFYLRQSSGNEYTFWGEAN